MLAEAKDQADKNEVAKNKKDAEDKAEKDRIA